MLRDILIISQSGLVLFAKEFLQGVATKPQMMGALLRTMLSFCTDVCGMPGFSYISLTTVGVAVCVKNKLTCVLFHDIVDGSDFGKLIASEMLDAFVRKYSSELENQMTSSDLFKEFNSSVVEIVRDSIRPVLHQLQQIRGITFAFLIDGDDYFSTINLDSKLDVLANHSALLNVSSDIMAMKNDSTQAILMKGEKTTTVLRRIERASLVVIYANNANPERCDSEICKAAKLLQQVLILISNLQDTRKS
eukprot:TRINITY_DN2290_c0_g1_i1.p1 TRINITY_DN2290_c0_g1~~TRINITY_DN2290_c0_g1_i1.p1  ORF type:complete len:249 (-),score=42.58 TRINITY_DN2290_c0_g1_i1:231-977(-)